MLDGFATAVPDHEVVTLFIDLEDDFAPGQTPDDLDDLIAEKLGSESILGPPDLIAAAAKPTLQAAVASRSADARRLGDRQGQRRGRPLVAHRQRQRLAVPGHRHRDGPGAHRTRPGLRHRGHLRRHLGFFAGVYPP